MDTMAAVAAEVAAALRISQGLAASRLRYARAMRERLPKTAEVFSAGDIGYLMFATIVYRTDLIVDPDVLAAVDAQLAANVARWPSMTKARLAGQVDKIVARADADAVRRRKEYRAQRQFWVGESQDGVCQIGGSLLAVDAHALDARLSALAGTVCEHDPRSREQRRADALGALAGGADRLGCGCGRADCAAGKRPAAPPVVIHLIAEAATINGTGSAPASQMNADGLITAELVAELAKTATLVPLVHPGDAPPEPGYAPSKALADFVRCRDLTCRWPGCDEPATNCDLDHTIPYAAGGPTHASNLKCYCRTHHLVKTFWGWRDQQLPDGTLILTSPSGHTYVSTPGSALLFPSLCHFSGGIPAPEADPPYGHCDQRTAMMPKRRRTRAQDRAYRIATERRQNHAARQRAQVLTQTAAATDTHGPPPDHNDDPPPFSAGARVAPGRRPAGIGCRPQHRLVEAAGFAAGHPRCADRCGTAVGTAFGGFGRGARRWHCRTGRPGSARRRTGGRGGRRAGRCADRRPAGTVLLTGVSVCGHCPASSRAGR